MATKSIYEQPKNYLALKCNINTISNSIGRYIKQGYFIIRTENGWRKEHRVVWEQCNKASLLSWTHIHHKNGDRQDNRIENLEPLFIGQHTTNHKTGIKLSQETKTKIGNSNKGKLKGRPFTEEHRRKISESLRGKPKQKRMT